MSFFWFKVIAFFNLDTPFAQASLTGDDWANHVTETLTTSALLHSWSVGQGTINMGFKKYAENFSPS